MSTRSRAAAVDDWNCERLTGTLQTTSFVTVAISQKTGGSEVRQSSECLPSSRLRRRPASERAASRAETTWTERQGVPAQDPQPCRAEGGLEASNGLTVKGEEGHADRKNDYERNLQAGRRHRRGRASQSSRPRILTGLTPARNVEVNLREHLRWRRAGREDGQGRESNESDARHWWTDTSGSASPSRSCGGRGNARWRYVDRK